MSGTIQLIIKELDLQLAHGERLALVGGSGSGKTVTALSLLKLNTQASYQGEIVFNGEALLAKTEAQIRSGEEEEAFLNFLQKESCVYLSDPTMESLVVDALQKLCGNDNSIDIYWSTSRIAAISTGRPVGDCDGCRNAHRPGARSSQDSLGPR
mgnify:CR=1 FL=1